VCEGQTAHFKCPIGTTVAIQKASFGRLGIPGAVACAGPNDTDLDCGVDVQDTVKGICDGKSVCAFSPSLETLHIDPCPNTFKLLNVAYSCVKKFSFPRLM